MKFKFRLSLPEGDPDAGKSSAPQPDPNAKEGIIGKYKSIIKKNDKKIDIGVKWKYVISGPIVKEVLNIDMGDLSTLKIDPWIPAGKDGIIAALIIAALGTSLDENMGQPNHISPETGKPLKDCYRSGFQVLCKGID